MSESFDTDEFFILHLIRLQSHDDISYFLMYVLQVCTIHSGHMPVMLTE